MNSFSKLIFAKNAQSNTQPTVTDKNGLRTVGWDEFCANAYKIADFAVERRLSGIVPVYMERSAEAFETILGLNLAGVGVAPLSITTPQERVNYISGQVENRTWTQETCDFVLSGEYPANDWDEKIKNGCSEKPCADNNAYVVFTSGSTGNPKGVLLSDNAVIGVILRTASKDFFDFEYNDIVLQSSSLSFIATASDLLAPLYSGASVHILPEAARGDSRTFDEYVRTYGITKFFAPPQFYRMLDCGPGVRTVCIGSDRIINIAPGSHRLVGVYGMSETGGYTFHYDITEAMPATPIGVPSVGIREYVIDGDGNPADEGEMCFAGAVSHGYFNLPEQTAETFTKNPFCDEPGYEILVHSGDIVRKTENGGYRYLNRKDNMIKVNGQRVEPGEIEIALTGCEGVESAAVKGFADDEGRSIICAYLVCKNKVDTDAVKDYLARTLPHYMVPEVFVTLDKMPLNANGKLDRKALKMPDFSTFRNEYVAPQTAAEKEICAAFEKALNTERVGVTDDFFRIGGDSIKALTVVNLCGESGITTGDVFVGRTPAKIAKLVEGEQRNIYVGLCKNNASVPLTDSQMGIYLECMLAPESKMYNIPAVMTVTGAELLSAERIKSAVDGVIKLHSALYAHINSDGERILMVRSEFPHGGICSVQNYAGEDLRYFSQPFDMANGPLCRVNAYIDGEKLYIVLDMHHIVSDGTSLSVVCDEICKALSGESVEHEQVEAFSLYEAETRITATQKYARAQKYFESVLSGLDTDSALIPDFGVAEAGTKHSKRLDFEFSIPDVEEKLKKTDITHNTLFMGAFGYALAKMTGRDDSVFTVGENGRNGGRKGNGNSSLLDNTVSMLVRTIPIHASPDETKPGSVYLKQLQNQFFASMSNDCVSFGELCREYGVNSDVGFVYQSDMFAENKKHKCTAKINIGETGDAFSKLNASVLKQENGYLFRVEYRTDLYKESTIRRFAGIFNAALHALLSDAPLSEMQLVTDAERELFGSFYTESESYPEGTTILDLFVGTVAKYPDKPAVVYKDKTYTYAEADKISDNIASYIHALGIGRNQTVSILIKRSEYIMLATFGVLKAGAVYQPLDPTYPIERLTFMTQDADTQLLIADRELVGLLPEYAGNTLFIDEIEALDGKVDTESRIEAPVSDDTYILLYTSGTTGKPKGVMLTHANMVAYVSAFGKILELNENSRIGSYASYGFDMHMADLYPSVAYGCTLYIIPDEIRLDFPALKDYCERERISNILMTTQVARSFAVEYSEIKGMKTISCGGEKLLPFNVSDKYRFFNLYGPTETTDCVTSFEVNKEYENIPIGKPMDNVRIYVADKFGRVVPVGVPGELIISGKQVAKGYLNRPEQTAKAFVPNIYEPDAGADFARCYRTGDVVRYLEDGNIEYIGRRDLQVKIRGFRIELSEVEKVIREYPDITDAAVIAVDENGGKCIHAYVVSPKIVDIQMLNRFIKEKKPAYMVPSATMQIEGLPLTPNHKVDRRKLPPIVKDTAKPDEGLRKLTELEEALLKLLGEIAGNGDFGVETEFADAGITSITSIKLATQIYKRFGLHLTSKEILDGGSVLYVENRIVADLMAQRGKSEPEKVKETLKSYPLTETQTGIYLDCLRAGTEAYNIPVMYKLPDGTDIDRFKAAVIAAVKAHPSMLCYIYADEKGDVAMYPAPDMEITVREETVDVIPPKHTEFAFTRSPLFAFRIIRNGGNAYFFAEMHHIISDGTSLVTLLGDIDSAYGGVLPTVETYTAFDMSLEEHAARAGKDLENAKAYYDSVFKGVSADYLPCSDRSSEPQAKVLNYTLNASLAEVKGFCKQHDITENLLFTGVFAILLSKYTAHEDALFSTIYNGRTDPRTERLVGMLVKTLPIYLQTAAETTVEEYLATVEKHLRAIKKYDIFSFADAAKNYGVNADVMFIYQGRLLSEMTLDGKPMEQIAVENDKPKAEISVEVFEDDNAYRLTVEYNGGRYGEDLIRFFADAYETCLHNFTVSKKLGDVDILSERSMHGFDSFNDTFYPVEYRPIDKVIEEQAKTNPDRLAVIASPEDADYTLENRTYEKLTYAQLDRMANNLANRLANLGIGAGRNVGIVTGRTKEVYIGEYGILKAGCAFLFMAPAYPDERIKFVSEDGELRAIVTTRAIAEKKSALFAELGLPLIFADEISTDVVDVSPEIYVDPDALAYMIYTSGSTGKPKGVMVMQKGLANLANNNPKNGQIRPFVNPVTAASTAFTFDASIIDGICSLANGMTVAIASDEDIHNPSEFRRMCLDNGVTGMIGTPSFHMSLLDYAPMADVYKNLQAIVAGGEAFTPTLYERLRALNPDMRIINGYGPSETTVCCSAALLDSPNRITIGTPISNYKIYIIDKQNHILPMGALGELAIVGIGVGKGYVKRSDLTEKAFFRLLGEPAYKSGDLALISADGEIEFHGRIDNQVKLRGLRIELGEIESAIIGYNGVKACIVTVNGAENNRFLAAYYTAEREINSRDIIAEISKTLAEYMVPRVFVQLDEMPMTANGKVDKKALPEPIASFEAHEYIAPVTQTEKDLCKAFQDALQLEQVGVTDDFFELGGTSLTATKVAMFALAHGINIAYKDVFANPTVEKLCKLVGKSDVRDDKNEFDGDYSLANKALEGNVWKPGEDAGNRPLGNILLTGATGFLGMHVLKEYLENESGDVYCLFRKGSFASAELRLTGMYIYYFDSSIEEQIGKRIHCIDGDITDAEGLSRLKNLPFDTLINCAACVKHFSNGDVLEKVNVEGVGNLIELCRETGKRLIHVSTVSVAGEGADGTPEPGRKLSENQLYFNQILENQYIISKFKAEKLMLDAIADGLDGKIMRAGNLMPRYSDGEFQINYLTNGFMRRLHGYYALGCIPYSALSAELEFSPIDETAGAVLALAETDRRFTVFHTDNIHKVFMSDVVRAMNKAGLRVDCIGEDEFSARLKAALENTDTNNGVGGLIAYLNRDCTENRYMIGCDNSFTAQVLNRIGYTWNITDDAYVVNALKQLDQLGFFELEI